LLLDERDPILAALLPPSRVGPVAGKRRPYRLEHDLVRKSGGLGGLRPLVKVRVTDEPDRPLGEARDSIGPRCRERPLPRLLHRRGARESVDGGKVVLEVGVWIRQAERDRSGGVVGLDSRREIAVPRAATLRAEDAGKGGVRIGARLEHGKSLALTGPPFE
jgi:hypothetical protein